MMIALVLMMLLTGALRGSLVLDNVKVPMGPCDHVVLQWHPMVGQEGLGLSPFVYDPRLHDAGVGEMLEKAGVTSAWVHGIADNVIIQDVRCYVSVLAATGTVAAHRMDSQQPTDATLQWPTLMCYRCIDGESVTTSIMQSKFGSFYAPLGKNH
jgi:hypothetical protein